MSDYEDYLGKMRLSKKIGGDWEETDEERNRRFEENWKYLEESRKEFKDKLSHPLKSLIPKEGIRTHDSEGNSSVTYPSLDSDAMITYYMNNDGTKSWERKESREDGSIIISKSDGSWKRIE